MNYEINCKVCNLKGFNNVELMVLKIYLLLKVFCVELRNDMFQFILYIKLNQGI